MLQDAYFLAKIGADAAENEQHFAEILPSAPPSGPPSWAPAWVAAVVVAAVVLLDAPVALRTRLRAALEVGLECDQGVRAWSFFDGIFVIVQRYC